MFKQSKTRRKTKRLEIAVPLHIKLLGMSKDPPTIETATRNVSPVGISMELPVTLTKGAFFIREGKKPINLIPYLALEKKEVSLNISLPPHEEQIKARGKIIWYDFGTREASYYFEAGIFLKEMEFEDRKRWEEFTMNAVLETGKMWKYLQVTGIFTFIAGIGIFIAGFFSNEPTAAKIGIALSFIGLIGSIIGWWQHRSFMLLKKFKLF